ncbi:hypothetical protein [Peribacillus sp. TH14]|nr:hypothetical protein [Peribacillus sp. TH14]
MAIATSLGKYIYTLVVPDATPKQIATITKLCIVLIFGIPYNLP